MYGAYIAMDSPTQTHASGDRQAHERQDRREKFGRDNCSLSLEH
jgi:hypothetical protein